VNEEYPVHTVLFQGFFQYGVMEVNIEDVTKINRVGCSDYINPLFLSHEVENVLGKVCQPETVAVYSISCHDRVSSGPCYHCKPLTSHEWQGKDFDGTDHFIECADPVDSCLAKDVVCNKIITSKGGGVKLRNLRTTGTFIGLEEDDWFIGRSCKAKKAPSVFNVFQVEADGFCCGIRSKVLEEIALVQHQLVASTNEFVDSKVVTGQKEEYVVQETSALGDKRDVPLL